MQLIFSTLFKGIIRKNANHLQTTDTLKRHQRYSIHYHCGWPSLWTWGSATHYGLPALPEPYLRARGLHRVCTRHQKSKQQSHSWVTVVCRLSILYPLDLRLAVPSSYWTLTLLAALSLQAALYQVSVRWVRYLPLTSFRFRVTADTLVSLARRFPLLGLVRDLHPLDNIHASQTKSKIPTSRMSVSWFFFSADETCCTANQISAIPCRMS